MSAKLLYSLSEDKKYLKRQMGCMNGLFQLFDRHHFMGAPRINPKTLPPPGDDYKPTQVEKASYKAKGDNLRHDPKDVSPRASPSMLHAESSQTKYLHDTVKENINRQVPGISVKTSVGRATRSVVKHIDSPRPLLPSAPIKTKFSGLDESLKKKLGTFQEFHNEGKDRSLLMTRKEARHRFSCDGRVTNSQDTLKTALKLKEQPRLSLDSRAGSTRRRSETDNYMSLKAEQEPDSRKYTSIVAKLMGLDTTESNEPSNADKNASHQTVASGFRKDPSKTSIQSRNRDTNMKPISSSRILVEPAPWKDISRGLQKPDFGEAIKNVPNSMPSVYGEMEKRVTELEFKKSSRDLRALKQILGAMQKSKENLQIKKEHASDSMSQSSYNSTTCSSHHQELKSSDRPDLSGHCITNGRESHQKKRASPIVVMKPANSMRSQHIKTSADSTTQGFSGLHKLRTPGHSKDLIDKHISSDRTLTSHLRDSSSPILHTDKNSIASPRAARIKTSRLTPPLTAENNNSGRTSGAVSPRLQQRLLRLDKKVQQTSPSPEPIRANRQPTEAGLHIKRIQLKASSLQKHGDELTEAPNNSCSSIQPDYLKSDNNISQPSECVTSTTDLDEMNAAFFWKDETKQESKSARLSKCRAMAGLNIIATEQPSPVSVLDDMFYRDESPSPVKKISKAFIDDECPEEQEWSIKHGTSNSTRSLASTDYDPERVYNGEHLFKEQVDLYSTTFGNSADYSLPHCEGKDQDHEYIFEILLASGLLQEPRYGVKTVQPHLLGHAIKLEIFEILEMKNAKRNFAVNKLNSNTVSKQSLDKIQRKLIFAIVNEILVRKSEQSSCNELSLLSSKVADIRQAKQKLLKDLWSEINQLQVTQSKCNYDEEYDEHLQTILLEDMQRYGPNGSEFDSEISGIVLDVERLIFKDLISEVISDAAESPRQLFSK